MPKIMLGVPNTGNLRTELVQWILQSGIRNVFFPQERPHDYCRNVIVNEFLHSGFDFEFLLMIDSDVVPVTDILSMAQHNVLVCSAHVCMARGLERIPVGFVRNEQGGYHHDYQHSQPGLHEVDVVGTGCVMIRRDVFASISKPYFKFPYDSDGNRVGGEDFNFCERVQRSSDRPAIYFDATQRCLHYTTIAI
jgi:hypothetical protein